jgi:hypothetical protein
MSGEKKECSIPHCPVGRTKNYFMCAEADHVVCMECLLKLITFCEDLRHPTLGNCECEPRICIGVRWKCPICRCRNGLRLNQLVAVCTGSWKQCHKMVERDDD